MTAQEMDRALALTLQDHRLTGSEKRALGALAADLQADEQQLALFRQRAFALAANAVGDPEARRVIEWLEDVVKVLQQKGAAALPVIEACFAPQHDCPGRIAGLFREARRSADVCVFTITDDRIADALLGAHARGVAVRVVTDNEKASDLGSDVERFRDAGVPVRVDQTAFHMHHKFAVFDGTWLVNGSYNWTRGAARDNKENLILTNDRRLVAAFGQAFEALWEELGR